MIHDVWFNSYHWMWREGVVGNIVASLIIGIPSAIALYRRVWKKHLLPHFERSKEIHRIITAPAPKPKPVPRAKKVTSARS